MPARTDRLIRYVRRLVAPAATDPVADAALLTRFLAGRDATAFEALVSRHGPMVLRVCHRLLGDAHAAEDAFQATFLVLARKAASVRPAGALAAWLHGVAYRVALGARAAAARRRFHESSIPDLAPPDPRPDPLAELSAREALGIVDEEVQRLPETYRLPVILCCLEGLAQEEAARRLGWTPGSVKGRLERGRQQLHDRLKRRGLALAAALALVETSRGAAVAGIAGALVAATMKPAMAFAATGPLAAAGVSPEVAALAEAGLRSMPLGRWKATLLLLLGVSALAGGVGALARGTLVATVQGVIPSQTAEPEATVFVDTRDAPGSDSQFGKLTWPKVIVQPEDSIPGPNQKPDDIFVPSPPEVVDAMLKLADVRPGDVVFDLGCGDGCICIAAAKQYNARAYGYDIDPVRVEESLENVKKNKVQDRVTIERRDIFKLDLSGADVVTLYLLRSLNARLIPQLEKMKPGSRIVSHDFDMMDIVKPDKVIELTDFRPHIVYLWKTPLKKDDKLFREFLRDYQDLWK